MEKECFGTFGSENVELYRLRNKHGMIVEVLTYGAIIRSIQVPAVKNDGEEKTLVDVVLGYDTLEGYLKDVDFIGCLIGRVANRIGGGKVTIGDKSYQLTVNDRNNHLHGGAMGFYKKMWTVKETTPNANCLELSYVSPSGEEGYPGQLSVGLKYELTNQNELLIKMKAQTDAPTIVNLTSHSYFNFDGKNSTNIYAQDVRILASEYLVTDENDLATGNVFEMVDLYPDGGSQSFLNVGEAVKIKEGSEFDLRQDYVNFGERLPKIGNGEGFNNFFVFDKALLEKQSSQQKRHGLNQVASARSTNSRIKMDLFSDQPGLQLYTAQCVNASNGKNGNNYGKHSGFCLETQIHPNAPNIAHFPDIVLQPGEEYTHTTIYAFETF